MPATSAISVHITHAAPRLLVKIVYHSLSVQTSTELLKARHMSRHRRPDAAVWLAGARSRGGQGGAGGAPDRRDAAAGRGEQSGRGQGDEGEEECILDEILSVLIFDESGENVFS
jgi:hypothetical protein